MNRLKQMVRMLIRKMGYDLIKVESPHSLQEGSFYTTCHPFSHRTHSPWFEEPFQKTYRRIKRHTVVTEDRCYVLQQLSHHCLALDGDFAECGVYKGGTAYLLALALEKAKGSKHLHLFDTFSGMPAVADADPSLHKAGDFGNTSLEAVRKYVDFPSVVFHPGLIPDTFGRIEQDTFCFVHIDVDLYQSVKDSLDFFYARLVCGGVIVCDDYGFFEYKHAAKKAVDEFFRDKPEIPIVHSNGQCIIIKR